jgi:ADP-ribose pyrophosphatase
MGEVAGATHEEAAPIELKEETGYTAQRFDHIGSYFLSPGWSTQEGHIYHATGLTAGTAEPEEFEFIDPVVVTVDQLQEHLDSGDISDASTITAFDRFQRTVLAQRS